MPRDLPLGNGSLLVNFDRSFQLRDLYWPRVGLENHTRGGPCRFGVWADGRFRWIDGPGWTRDLRYGQRTLVTEVTLSHPELALRLTSRDAVDFHENLYVRCLEVTNGTDRPREVRLFFHHDLSIASYEVGDTAYYEPERRAVIHYKGPRWFLMNAATPGRRSDDSPDTAPGWHVGVDQWACGYKGVQGLQGTWKDADDDGHLSGNAIAQGFVDSTVAVHLRVPPLGSESAYYWIAIGDCFDRVVELNRMVRQRGPWTFLDRTASYWRLWLDSHLPEFAGLPPETTELYDASLLILRTQIDHDGAILAANDSDITSTIRDTYSYMWPRDGALVAHALDLAGYLDITRPFFVFCRDVLTKEGYLLHKYGPDRSLASSWHPWLRDGQKELPIQEDETALVLWALWQHFERWRDVEFVKPLYRSLVVRAAEFLASYRDPESGLPLESYDLWEERRGVHAFTTAAVWAGLLAGARFTRAFGEERLAASYEAAASAIRAGAEKILHRPDLGRFVRTVTRAPDGGWRSDETLDASLFGLWYFGLFEPDDPRVVRTMESVASGLRVQTEVGGIARYRNDTYHQQTHDLEKVPGNPWFLCTLWLAQWRIATARSRKDLVAVADAFRWCVDHGLPSGVLAEQVNPYTHEPLSVSPLTWSHATYLMAVQEYLARWRSLAE
jgi:GH15 family glucan-1,4-alpha-glucosidase